MCVPTKNEHAEPHPSAAALDRHRDLPGVRAREDDVVLDASLVGDVRARVARADDEHRPVLQLRQVAVVVRVKLGDARIELARELGRVRPLEDARGDDDVVGLEAPLAGVRDVAAVLLRQRVDRRAAAHRAARSASHTPRGSRPSRPSSGTRCAARGTASPAARRETPASRAAASPSASATSRRSARSHRG